MVAFVIVGDEAGLEDIAEDENVVEEGGTRELISLVITEMPDVLDTEGVDADVGSARKWSVTAELPQPMLSQVSGPAVRRAVEQNSVPSVELPWWCQLKRETRMFMSSMVFDMIERMQEDRKEWEQESEDLTNHARVIVALESSMRPHPKLQEPTSTHTPANPQSVAEMTAVGHKPHISFTVSTLQSEPEFAVRGLLGSPLR